MFCQNCGTRLEDTDRFCRKCGLEVPKAVAVNPTEDAKDPHSGARTGRIVLAIAGLVLLTLLAGIALAPKSGENGQLSRKAALAYLDSFASNGESLAREMSQASLERANNLREALETAEAVENRAYTDYTNSLNPINTENAGVSAADIQYVHDTLQKALAQCLAYWGDGDTRHVVEGTANFKQALLEANEVAIKLRR